VLNLAKNFKENIHKLDQKIKYLQFDQGSVIRLGVQIVNNLHFILLIFKQFNQYIFLNNLINFRTCM